MHLKRIAISSLIFSLVGSMIFLFVTPPASFVLFTLFFFLATVITMTLLGKMFLLKIPIRGTGFELHVFLMLSSVAVLILQLGNIYNEAISSVLYGIVFIFALGFSCLSLLKFRPSFSRIEFIALAYPLSLASLAIFGMIALVVPSSLMGIVLSIMVMLLCATSLFMKIRGRQPEVQKQKEFILKNNELILAITLLIFVFFFIELYPLISRFLYFDIARNFLTAIAFTKNTLGNFSALIASYPLFGVYQSSIVFIVKPSIETFQVATVFLSIFTILSFYAMATQYLRRYGDHTPAIATLIWSAFSGFGWLTVLSQRIDNPSASLLSFIGQADTLSYGDLTWHRLFFYLSMETTFALVFAVLYFLKRKDLSRTKQVLLMTFLITPIPLMHPYGVYLLLLTLICFAIICTVELKQQITYSGYSLIIASFASLLLNYVLRIETQYIPLNIQTFLECLGTGLAIIAITSMRNRIQRKPTVIIRNLLDNKCTFPIMIFLVLFFFASLFLWFSNNIAFNFSSLNFFGYVPGFLYPVKLGIIGVLAIVAMYLLLTNSQFRSKELGAFLASALLMIFISIILSAMQMQYVSTFTLDQNSSFSEGIRNIVLMFREERMFEVIKIPLAMISSIVLSKYIVNRTKLKKIHLSKYVFVAGFVSIVLISGMASTFIGFEYYHNLTQTNSFSSSEIDMISTMQNSLYTSSKATIVAPQILDSYLDFTGTNAIPIITELSAAWESKSPELPLLVTRYSETTPTYIYLDKTGNYQNISTFSGSYLKHISDSVTQPYIENKELQVKEINNTSIPVSQSTTALVVPFDSSRMTLVNPLFQEKNKQYTVAALYFEKGAQSQNIFKDPINYTNVEINGSANFNGQDSYIRINGTQTNFNKLFIDFTFQPLNLTQNRVLVSKFDWGTPSQKSWEIVQNGKAIGFKISSDGANEKVLSTNDVLQLNNEYNVDCEYDGVSMQIFVNKNLVATQSYQNGIFASNTDITISSELSNNHPTSFAKILLKDISILNEIPQATVPIFPIYDLLSSLGLNYTTILSNDSSIGKYETLILPYDDITTQQIITKIEALPQKNTRYIEIINSNGYGPMMDIFGNETSQTFVANKILAGQNFTMAQPIEVPKIDLNNNTITETQYINNNSSSPLVMTNTQDQPTLIYINIYPLLLQNQLLNPTSLQILTKTLSNYSELCNETTISSWFIEPSLLFASLQADGAITIKSSSIASITLPENQSLNTNRFNTILINSTKIDVQNGYGFYTTLIASNPSITLEGDQRTYVNVKGNVTFLLRQPEITVNGNIQFKNFYMMHPPTIYTDGRTTTLSGKITLNIYVSDGYTIALPYKFQSPIIVKYQTPLMEFNETASLMQLLPYILILAMIAVSVLLLERSKPSYSKENQKPQDD